MVIKRTIDKETVKDLPKAAFPGQIHVVQTPWEAEKAVAYLKSCPLLGIDSETRPSFTKGQIHKVALLQISSEEHCFLFRLNLTGLTLPVITLLENPSVTKVGLSLRDDFMICTNARPSNSMPASNCRNMSALSASRTKACRRYTPSSSGKRFRKASAFPTGKPKP